MYNVSALNPMIFGGSPFFDEPPFIISSKFVHNPPKQQFHANVLLIGIGYSDALRDQWMSENHPIKYAYVQQNPLVAYLVPDMEKKTVVNHDTNEQVNLNNVVKKF